MTEQWRIKTKNNKREWTSLSTKRRGKESRRKRVRRLEEETRKSGEDSVNQFSTSGPRSFAKRPFPSCKGPLSLQDERLGIFLVDDHRAQHSALSSKAQSVGAFSPRSRSEANPPSHLHLPKCFSPPSSFVVRRSFAIAISIAMAPAAIRDIVSDPSLLPVLNTAGETRDLCHRLLSLLDPSLTPDQISESPQTVQKQLFALLAQLRGQNRDAIFRVRDTKQGTAEARQEIDRLHLQLQNLYYEQRHLTGEIAACESYEYVTID